MENFLQNLPITEFGFGCFGLDRYFFTFGVNDVEISEKPLVTGFLACRLFDLDIGRWELQQKMPGFIGE
ncbi:hypothetical protein AKJ61_01185 [candidate division MSBL1 archaeon SCGC-AAA259B11]|uniref:Uncharacterized protein n=1 Tax=candidate division MSBL1 archaeon SCGC-AAA259B11 TaxID=1698260 RepID=A0A133U7K1_9EURY|nr:hypothetical protein AKJ61_01185 [candidate division MSBL1 archaeon SCGC-AAA259B11]